MNILILKDQFALRETRRSIERNYDNMFIEFSLEPFIGKVITEPVLTNQIRFIIQIEKNIDGEDYYRAIKDLDNNAINTMLFNSIDFYYDIYKLKADGFCVNCDYEDLTEDQKKYSDKMSELSTKGNMEFFSEGLFPLNKAGFCMNMFVAHGLVREDFAIVVV